MNVLDQGIAIGNLFKIFALFFMAFYVMPSMVFKPEKNGRDEVEFFYPIFFKGSFFIIIMVHLASLTGLMDSMAILVLTLISMAVGIRYRRKNSAEYTLSLLDQVFIYVMDLADSGMSLWGKTKFIIQSIGMSFLKWMASVYRLLKANLLLGILTGGTFAYGLFIRVVHPLNHYYLASSDAYLHLVWTKYLRQQGLYSDGLYPHGLHSAFAYLSTIFNTDAYYFFRFLGPLIGLLILYSIYHFVKQHLNVNPYAPWMAVAFYTFISTWPTQVWRQLSPLPQEYAMVFMLPTLHFLILYVENHRKNHLWLFGVGVALNFLIHVYSGIFVLLAAGIYLCFSGSRVMKARQWLPILKMSLAGILAGFMPLGIGWAVGVPFHPSFGFFLSGQLPGTAEIVETVSAGNTPSFSWLEIFQIDFSLMLALIPALMLFIWSVVKDKWTRPQLGMTAFMTLILYLLYRGDLLFQRSMPIIPDRSGVFFSIFAAITLGVFMGKGLQTIKDLVQSKGFVKQKGLVKLKAFINLKGLENGAALAILALLILNFGTPIPQGTPYEYDQAVQAYLSIVEGQGKGTMTLIAPQEQFQEIYGQGYHYQLWNLMRDQIDETVKTVKMPTTDVYLFVEKIPFGFKEKIRYEDAVKPFPEEVNNLNAYYQVYRPLIQAKAFYWAESFMKAYPKETSVYYEDAYLKIYRIHQDQLNPINLKTAEPQEVFGK